MEIVILVLELIGTVAFSVSGAMTAVKNKLDIFGAVVVGAATAVGGGVIRDILLGKIPPTMFEKPIYVSFAFAASLLVFGAEYVLTQRKFENIRKNEFYKNIYNQLINAFDAIGLAVFVIVGVNSAIVSQYKENLFFAIFLGAITGVGGGVMRDIFVGKIPMILYKRVYAIAAIIGAVLYYYLYNSSVPPVWSMLACMLAIIIIRFLAAYFRWNLPKIQQEDMEPEDRKWN